MKIDADKIIGGKGRQGMTLIELMVALVVVAISVLAFYQMFITGNMLISEQYERRTALERAQAWMEKMKYYENELDTVPRSFASSFTDTLVAADDQHEALPAEVLIDVTHSQERDAETGIPYYSNVSVVYKWTARSGREYTVELRSKF